MSSRSCARGRSAAVRVVCPPNSGSRSHPPRPRLGAVAAALGLALVASRRVAACDICAIYTATEQSEARTGFRLGVAEQYSHFGTELLDGEEVTLPAKEYMDSSVTQFLLGYGFTPRFGLQLSIPLVDRQFRRIHDHRIQEGNETGIGDLALVGNFLAFSNVTENSVFRFSLLGGVKFPSGDPSLLGEEVGTPTAAALVRKANHTSRPHDEEAPPSSALPEQGGLHGHDLALGSGSYDGIVGGQIYWSWKRLYATAAMQYAIRSTGAFDYRYANDLTWIAGPGMYALVEHAYTLGVQLLLTGETKGNDTQAGVKANDTAITALYLGPGATFTWGTSLAADLAVDVPVYQHDTSLQLVPDVRVRGGLTWRF